MDLPARTDIRGGGARPSDARSRRAVSEAAPVKRAGGGDRTRSAATAKPAHRTRAEGRTGSARTVVSPSARRQKGLGALLPVPEMGGPKVRLGILWFLVALAGVIWGRWATVAVWAPVAAVAAAQVTRRWSAEDGSLQPGWSPLAAAVAAVAVVVAAGIGTALGGLVLAVAPLVVVVGHLLAARPPGAAGAAVAGIVLAAVPAGSVVLVARLEWWAALFLVFAVSFYDAGYFVGAAESRSAWEGPLTGMLGMAAVTFAASAIESPPFDRTTAWAAGALLALACPLGQMITSAFLPRGATAVPAMRRLDAWVVAAPIMVCAVWSLR